LAISRYLLKHGHNVVATARSGHLLQELLSEYPKQLCVISGNITNNNLAYSITEAATENFGKIDGLVINQGTMEPVERIGDSKVDDWKQCFDVNFFSAISLVR
jgi:NADP-dependent 3-hydroxy acid dehydrogenase YdfG